MNEIAFRSDMKADGYKQASTVQALRTGNEGSQHYQETEEQQ